MAVRRRVVVALSMLATGMATAFFFRKDQSGDGWPSEVSQKPFDERVEHRVAGASWVRQIGAPLAPQAQAQRVAPITTAAIGARSPAAEGPPTLQTAFNPLGALLDPIGGARGGGAEPAASAALEAIDEGRQTAARAQLVYTVVDGDTLSQLAERFLGRAERAVDIFELNRDVLASPDVLPIGTALKIPGLRGQPPRASGSKPAEPRAWVRLRRGDTRRSP